MVKIANQEVLKYTKDSLEATLEKLNKQLKLIEAAKEKKVLLENIYSQTKEGNGTLFLQPETKLFLNKRLEKEIKANDDKIKKLDDIKKRIEIISNLNNQVSLK